MVDSSKPSWRRGNSGAGRGTAATGKGWQNRRVKTSQSAVSSHRAKLIGLGLVVIALATYFAVKVFFIPVKTPLLILAATHYRGPFPPNSYAQEDAALIGKANTDNLQPKDLASADLKRDELLRHLDGLPKRGGGPNKNTILVYLSAHGVVNDQAEPCLLLADSSSNDTSTWLPFSEIIGKAKSRPDIQIVMLLDTGRIDHDWSLAILHNGFPDRLEKQLQQAAVGNLHVMCAASSGEKSWVAPEVGASVFGYFTSRALGNAASKNDDVITLRELSDYLKKQVSAWVAQNRASRQTPRLLTAIPSPDIAVAYRGENPVVASDASTSQRIAADWKVVSDLWLQLERTVQERKLIRYEPSAVARMQRQLLRAEQLLLSGSAYRSDLDSTLAQVRTLLQETDPRMRLPTELQAFSFPLQEQLGGSKSDVAARTVVLKKWIEAKGKPQLKEGEPPLPAIAPTDALAVAWEFIRQLNPPTRAQLQDSLSLVDEATRTGGPGTHLGEPAEVLFLRMAAHHTESANGSAEFSDATQRYLQRCIAIRELAEQAAAPEDVRAHYWLQSLVDESDNSRRLAEDALFCDGVSSLDIQQLTKVSETRFQFRDKYTQAVLRGQQLGAAYVLRDDIYAGLPFLADWLLNADDRIRSTVIPNSTNLSAAIEALDSLASKNHQLAAMLDNALTTNELDTTPISTYVKELNTSWNDLRDSFVEHCQDLKDRAGQNKLTLREIGEALRVPSPWLEAEERERLATKYQNILFADSNAGADSIEVGSGEPSAEDKAATVPPVFATAKHPLWSLLSREQLPLLLELRSGETKADETEENVAIKIARQEARIRRRLSDLSPSLVELEDITSRRLEVATETAGNSRAGMSEADRLSRAMAPVTAALPADPAHRLRRVDLHFQFLWHARRAIDDFWGPAPGAAGAAPYFSIVADSYISGARRLENKHQSLIHQQVNLSQLLSDRKNAILGTRLEPQDVTSLGDSPSAEQQIHIEWNKDLPVPGVAALFLEGNVSNSQSQLIPVLDRDARPFRRQPLPVGKSPATDVVHMIPTQQLTASNTDQELTAKLLFRGHTLQRPFSVRGSVPLLVTVNPQLPRRAKITVKGEGNRRAFIAFVFDCSDSMNEDGRLAKATAGLARVLDALKGDTHYHVGLFAYGHRARFGLGNAFVGPGGVPVAINPDHDVELLQPVQQLDDVHWSALKRQLNELKAAGVTPLYHAIRFALRSDQFKLARPEDTKHIIVISDGIDYQFNERTTVDDVKQVLSEPRFADVQIDVVMFGKEALLRDSKAQQIVRNRGSTLEREFADIGSLATQTRGQLLSAEDPDQLTSRLRDALKLVEYSVSSVEPPTSSGTKMDLGKDWPLLKLPPAPTEYIVRLHGLSRAAEQKVRIEGGEALELQYDPAEDHLTFPRYRRGDSREAIEGLVDPRTNEEYRVLPILPRKNLQRVEFEVAIQNRDRLKFTPRPPHVWAQIQPLSESETDSEFTPYHFFDAEFVPDTPVPVFRFVIPNWPAGATKAGLQVWVKFDSPPLETNGAGTPVDLKTIVIKEDIPQVTFRTDIKQIGDAGRGWRVTVWEEHEPGTELFTSRVQARPAPDQLRHQFFVGIDRVKHEFDYVEKPAPTIYVTARDRIMSSAITVPRVIMAVRD